VICYVRDCARIIAGEIALQHAAHGQLLLYGLVIVKQPLAAGKGLAMHSQLGIYVLSNLVHTARCARAHVGAQTRMVGPIRHLHVLDGRGYNVLRRATLAAVDGCDNAVD